MSRRLGDGSLIPSNLHIGPRESVELFTKQNFALRTGIVSRVIYPDHKDSITKKEIEYDVQVVQNVGKNGPNLNKYRNCRVNNIFGASNNSLVYTLQEDPSNSPSFDDGASVLVLCVDGSPDNGQAIIVGGLSNGISSNKKYKKSDGQFYDFNFNGINININKDGEYTLEFSSPVDVKGKKSNEKASGTKIKVDKDGRVKISDNESQSWELDRVAKKSSWTNGNESISIDKENKKIELNSSGEISQSSKKKTSISSEDAIDIKSKSNASVATEANMKLEAKGNLAQKSGGSWQVDVSGNAMIKAGGNLIMQSSGNAQMNGLINQIGAGTVPVAAVGISMCVGIGNLSAPVVSTIITGSSTVFVGA